MELFASLSFFGGALFGGLGLLAYRSFGTPLRIGYRDCAEYERRLQDHPTLRRARDYWTARLDTLPAAPELPLAVQPGALTEVEFKRRPATVPAPTWQRLKAQARHFGATPTVLLLAAFSQTLRAWSKSPDFTLNLTLFNRLPVHEDVASLLGDFTTTNLLAVHARMGDSFVDRLQRLQQQLAQDLEHRQYSGMRVLRDRGTVTERDSEAGRRRYLVTVHPSSVLRGPPEDRDEAMAALVADLRVAAEALSAA